MPFMRKLFDGIPRAWTLEQLYFNRKKFIEDPEADTRNNYPGQPWLMGYALPPFQRPLVWETERMEKFIESAALGLHLGTWVYNNAGDAPMAMLDGRKVFHETDRWLIDGQQRLAALDRFWNDDFQAFGYYWSDLARGEQRRFLSSTAFGAHETHIYDKDALRELYDRLNFGGIAHTQEQRATADDEAIVPSGMQR